MPFPISIRGTLHIYSSERSALLASAAAVESAMREAQPTSLTVTPEEITFRNGQYRFVNGGNQLAAINSGQIRFSKRGDLVVIHYRISFLHFWVMVILLVGFDFAFISGASFRIFLIPLWLFCGCYLTTLYRFPRFLRAAAEKGLADASAASLAE